MTTKEIFAYTLIYGPLLIANLHVWFAMKAERYGDDSNRAALRFVLGLITCMICGVTGIVLLSTQ